MLWKLHFRKESCNCPAGLSVPWSLGGRLAGLPSLALGAQDSSSPFQSCRLRLSSGGTRSVGGELVTPFLRREAKCVRVINMLIKVAIWVGKYRVVTPFLPRLRLSSGRP